MKRTLIKIGDIIKILDSERFFLVRGIDNVIGAEWELEAVAETKLRGEKVLTLSEAHPSISDGVLTWQIENQWTHDCIARISSQIKEPFRQNGFHCSFKHILVVSEAIEEMEKITSEIQKDRDELEAQMKQKQKELQKWERRIGRVKASPNIPEELRKELIKDRIV